jgi:hypothetical protein
VESLTKAKKPESGSSALQAENKELREKLEEAIIGQRVLRNTIATLESQIQDQIDAVKRWEDEARLTFAFLEFKERSGHVLLQGFKEALASERAQHEQNIKAKNAQIEQLSAELLQKREFEHTEDYLRLFDENLHPELWQDQPRPAAVEPRTTAVSPSRGRSASPDKRDKQKKPRKGSAAAALRRLLDQ